MTIVFVGIFCIGRTIAAPPVIEQPARPSLAEVTSAHDALSTKRTWDIDGHTCMNPYEILLSSDRPHDKFARLHQERIWAVTELDQKQAERSKLLDKPHNKPEPVPAISDSEYRYRVNDIDSKVRTFEAKQNNREVSKSDRAEAHAQLLRPDSAEGARHP